MADAASISPVDSFGRLKKTAQRPNRSPGTANEADEFRMEAAQAGLGDSAQPQNRCF
jgi:hypothetical protein